MNIDDKSLTSLNQEFKEYENINIDYDTDVLDFWRQKFPLLSQVTKRICFLVVFDDELILNQDKIKELYQKE
jgi:hypothetical protein